MFARRRSAAAVAVIATSLAVFVPAGAASAVPAAAAGDKVAGKGSSAIADFAFEGFNMGGSPNEAGGNFRGSNVFVDFAGPITCLQVDGNRAGFLYPIRENAKPSFAAGQVVLISIEDNGADGDRMGFLGPAPAAAFATGCAPGPTPIDIVDGGVTVRAGK
ncbi:MAG: hypothetical protein ACT4QF_16520 [Sporichthyaceae bacterium]